MNKHSLFTQLRRQKNIKERMTQKNCHFFGQESILSINLKMSKFLDVVLFVFSIFVTKAYYQSKLYITDVLETNFYLRVLYFFEGLAPFF